MHTPRIIYLVKKLTAGRKSANVIMPIGNEVEISAVPEEKDGKIKKIKIAVFYRGKMVFNGAGISAMEWEGGLYVPGPETWEEELEKAFARLSEEK